MKSTRHIDWSGLARTEENRTIIKCATALILLLWGDPNLLEALIGMVGRIAT